jgi:ABC-2 type transport system ATP-binding protein
MQALQIEKISKSFGSFKALDEVSLTIEPGVYGLLGPNGAGKSTLMRILTTLQPADSGQIQYGNVTWDRQHDVKKMIGYLPQKFSMYKHVKVREALEHVALMKGVDKDRKILVQRVLQQVNLEDAAEKKIGQLSGGMVRRVGIAQAILGDPKIILVDEPTAGLDPEERIRFRNILQTLGGSSVVIISSHIVEDIETICEQAAILYKGKILTRGSVEELKRLAKGKIWSCTIDKQEFSKRQQELKIIAQNIYQGQFKLRVLSDTPPIENAQPEEPTLEDAYFYCMKQVEGRHV